LIVQLFSTLLAFAIAIGAGGGGGGGGGGPDPTVTLPPVPTATVAPAPPTGTPTPLIAIFSERTKQPDYLATISVLLSQNAFIREQVTAPEVNFYAVYADLYPVSVEYLDLHPLVVVILPNVEMEDASDDREADVLAERDADDEFDWAALNSTVKLLSPQAIPGNVVVRKATLNNRNGDYPYHLMWMNSLWAKLALAGSCKLLLRAS
jgi:hypothetical protein